MDARGRACPLAYRYQPDALAQPRSLEVGTLLVVGGLYGNVLALDALPVPRPRRLDGQLPRPVAAR